jgi:AcrR family transcriptional regulator
MSSGEGLEALRRQAAEAHVLFDRFIALTRAALDAVSREDGDALRRALDERDVLTGQLDRALAPLLAARARHLAERRRASGSHPIDELLAAIERIARQARNHHQLLVERVTACRARLGRDLDALRQGEAVITAYQHQQNAGADGRHLDLRG